MSFIGKETRLVCMLAARESQILDIAGPLEVFAKANRFLEQEMGVERTPYEIRFLSLEPSRTIQCNNGLSLVAHAHYREARGAADTLLIAGGEVLEAGGASRELLTWLQRQAKRVRRLGSICTGAYLLAEAGLLDNC
jgi:transcriptional regulator GlxA family with amidase domain